MIKELAIVGFGSFLGGAFRYYLSIYILSLNLKPSLPYPTLIINILGCFLIGIAAGFIQENLISNNLRLFLLTGILGGFTTFSAFGYESLMLIKSEHFFSALSYCLASVFFGIFAVFLGLKITNQFLQ